MDAWSQLFIEDFLFVSFFFGQTQISVCDSKKMYSWNGESFIRFSTLKSTKVFRFSAYLYLLSSFCTLAPVTSPLNCNFFSKQQQNNIFQFTPPFRMAPCMMWLWTQPLNKKIRRSVNKHDSMKQKIVVLIKKSANQCMTVSHSTKFLL